MEGRSHASDVVAFVEELGLNPEKDISGVWYCECPRGKRGKGKHSPGLVIQLDPELSRFFCPACNQGGDLKLLSYWAKEEHEKLYTDVGNARRLIELHGANIRWTSSGWVLWNSRSWTGEPESTIEVMRLAKTVSEELLLGANRLRAKEDAVQLQKETIDTTEKPKKKEKFPSEQMFAWVLASQSLGHLRAMVDLAKSEPGIFVNSDSLDLNPYYFNVHNGVIDLSNGGLRQHDPKDLITKISNITYIPGSTCPQWEAFLQQVFQGDAALIRYVQRAVGYSLTGLTTEHALFFLHGRGKNGKSTFVNIISDLLGDYGISTSPEALMARRDRGIPTDIARLRGARFVSAIETGENRRFDEPLIKQLTGGDRMAARFLYANEFQFTPTFKLWIAGNHKPTIRGTDDGIWRRVRLIPFDYQVPDGKEDPELIPKLRSELIGILNWAVEGCLMWQKDRLGESKKVTEATTEYREESDIILSFLDEITEPTGRVSKQGLYTVYKDWCEDRKEYALPFRKFNEHLERSGFASQTSTGRAEWIGFRLRVRTA